MFIRTTALTPVELRAAIVREPLVVSPDTTVMEAIAQMSGVRTICQTTKTADSQLDNLHLEARSSCVLVVENGQLLGIVTERDVVRLSAQQQTLDSLVMRQVMAHPIITLRQSAFTDLFFAINLLQHNHIRHLPIVDEQNRLVGLVTHESLRQTSRPIDLLRLRLVSEVMTSEVICAAPDTSMLAIAQRMSEHRISSVMIVEPGDRPEPLQIPVGIVTERDLVQFQALGLNLETCTAQAVMSTPIFAVRPDDSLWTVQQMMEQRSIRRLAVTGEQGELLGIVTQTSLLQALNPLELYKLAEKLEEKVVLLEAEKIQLLENLIEQEVEARTIALKTKVQREKLVADLATQIRSSLSLQTILDTTVEQVRQFLGCDRVNIWQCEADWQIIAVAESTNSPLSLLGERINDTCFKQDRAEIYRQGRIRVVPDIYTTKMSDCHRNLLIRLQTRAKIIVPLLCGDELWGLLNASESQHARDWLPEEVELLQALSLHLAIALQQATTHQQLQDELVKRQRIEATLLESEQRYATLAAAAPVGIFRTDAAGLCTYINDRCFQLTGITPEAIIGKGWQQALHPDDRDWVMAEWEQFIQYQQPFQLEYRFQRPDGMVTWVYGQSVAERDANGQVVGYLGTVTDITDRKLALSALIQSEAHQRALISAIPDLIMRIDRAGIYLEFVATSANFKVVSNLSEMVGSHVFDSLPPDVAQKRMDFIQRALEMNSIQIYEHELCIDGRKQIEEVRVVPYSKDEVLALVRDISDRKLAEAALIQSEAQSRAILAAIPDFMFRMSADGIYRGGVTANREIDFLPPDFDTAGLAMVDVVPAEIAIRHLHYLEQALRTGELQVYEQQVQIGDRFQDEEVRVVKSSEDEVLFMIRDISDRKQAERQLHQLNQQLEAKVAERTQELWQVNSLQRAILDGADYSIISTDLTGIIQTFNTASEGLLGYSAAEMIGKATPAIFHDVREVIDRTASLSAELGQDIPPGFEVFVVKARQGIVSEEECSYIRKDGSHFPVSLSITALKDANQQIIGFLGIAKDISDRKRAEAELQKLSDRLALSLKSGAIACWEWDIVQNTILGDDRMYELFGLTKQSDSYMAYDFWENAVHPHDRTSVNTLLQQAVLGQAEYNTEYRVLHPDGSIHFLKAYGVVVRDAQGNPQSMIGVNFDISDRKQAEAELQKLSDRLALSLKSGAIGCWEWDIVHNIILWDERMYELYGVTKQSDSRVVYDIWANGLHPDDRIPTETLLQQAVLGQGEYDTEFRVLHPDGSIHFIKAFGVVVRDAQGNPQGMTGVNFDISDRKQAELERQQENTFRQQIVENMAEGLCVCHEIEEFPFVRFTVWNQQMQAITGYTLEDINRLGWHQSLCPDSEAQEQAIACVRQIRQGKNLIAQEREIQRKDGQKSTVAISTSVLSSNNGHNYILALIQDITDRKQTEQAMTQQQAAIEAAIDGIAIMQGDTYLYLNQAHLELFGYEHPQELVGKTWKSLYSPEELERFEREVFPVLGRDRAWQGEAIATRKDGSTFTEGLSLTITDGLLICVCRDISDRKQAELALQSSEIRFRRVFDSSVVGMIFANFQGHIIDANDRFLQMVGYTREELDTGMIHWDAMTPPEYVPADLVAMEYLMQHGAIDPWEKEYYRKDGSRISVLIGAALLPGSNDQTICVLVDISDRKQAEKALQESQQFLQTVLDTIPLPLFWKNRESVFLGCNHQLAKSLNLTSTTEIIGKTDFELSTTDAQAIAYRASDRRVMESGEGKLGIEEALTLPSGEQIWIETHKAPLRDWADNVIGVVGMFQDMTDRKQTEQRLQQQAEQERLLGSITQRIRSSLNLDEILKATVEEVNQVLQSDRVLVYRVFPGGTGAAIAEFVLPKWPKILDIVFPEEVFPEQNYDRYIQGRVYALSDREDENQSVLPCLLEFLASIHVRAKLVVPIVQNQTLWGLLIAHNCDRPRQWEDWEINLLKQIANQLAIAIQQANLYEQVQSELVIRKQAEEAIALQLQRQRTLGAIVQQIRESLDLNQILATVTQQVKEILQGDRIIVFRLFGDRRSQIVEEAVFSDFPTLKNRHWDDEVWAQKILESYWQGKPRIVPDVKTDIWTDCLVEYSIEGQIQSKIVAPILQEVRTSENHRWVAPGQTNKLWGVLVVHACREKRVWQESEAQLLQQIANQLAIAIQQASLFEQLQQELTERQQAQQQITERNQQLAISNEELARATRLKDEFLANMSHELRTPLNAILGMTEGLQEQVFGTVNEQQIKALQTIDRSGSHLLELINDILDVAKIESGQMELDYTTVSINYLCQSSLAFIKQLAFKKRIQLEIKLPLNLPDLLIDERRIRQVLINLLNNAVKFTPEGGRITLEVSSQQRETVLASPSLQGIAKVSVYQKALEQGLGIKPQLEGIEVRNYLRIAVIDTGIGIAPENINKLFQPFIQIDSALNRQYAGTGLGLALVKRIVELHCGEVGLTSTIGVGSCFTIDIPCAAIAPSSATEPISARTSDLESQGATPIEPTQPELLTSPLILLAEDNEANITTFSSYLGAKGYRILLAKNGQEAITLAKSENPDLILMDIQMPGMDGLEAMQQIRLDPNLVNIPIIALTALAMMGDRDRCLAAGANDYLTKPVKLKQLAATIQQLLTS